MAVVHKAAAPAPATMHTERRGFVAAAAMQQTARDQRPCAKQESVPRQAWRAAFPRDSKLSLTKHCAGGGPSHDFQMLKGTLYQASADKGRQKQTLPNHSTAQRLSNCQHKPLSLAKYTPYTQPRLQLYTTQTRSAAKCHNSAKHLM
jgi:hypothetical protein